jgi:DNA (cytosine-5)-methyltransferase 1
MKKTIKVGSDFSGVGAFDQALLRLGINYETVFACDMDKYARITYIHNFGEPAYYPQNVYDREIPAESLDIYMTSPPCQAFSLAGKRLGKDDKRGILFFNSHEFINKNKPRFFIFENVKGLLSDDGDKTFQEWVNLLGGKSVNGLPILFPYEDSVPYHIYWKVLNAKEHGVPQNRERVFIIGIRDDQDNNFRFPAEEHLTKKLTDVLENDVSEKYYLTEKILNDIMFDNYKVKSATKCGYEIVSEGDSINFSFPNSKTRKGRVGKQVAQTLDTACNQAIYTNRIRRLTPRECFRLMDFPDSFDFSCVSDTQAYKQAGNSIVVRVLEKIIKNLPL